MNAESSEKLVDPAEAANEFEGEIRELIRTRDVTFLRSSSKPLLTIIVVATRGSPETA